MEKRKTIFRLTDMILDSLKKLRHERYCQIQGRLEEFSYKCSDAGKYNHIFYAAVEKNWPASVEKVKKKVARNLNDYSYHFQQFRDFINTELAALPNCRDIFAELIQAEQEFGELGLNFEEKYVSVFTDPISLEDVSFGTFEIRLLINEIPNLFKDSPYRVIALDPNPAGSDDSVTHPHVSAERLCEGDGHTAIRKALEYGRINDFFGMVISILRTYNPESPYVSLSDWEGYSCYDCGYTMSSDDSYYCDFCMNDYCSSCSTYCQICDRTICLGCAFECPSCNEPVCRNCTVVCADCGERYCKDCLNESNLCQECQDNRKENKDEDQTENNETNTEIYTYGMGKADIHA